MKTAFRVSTFVWAGMILGSLAAAVAVAQSEAVIRHRAKSSGNYLDERIKKCTTRLDT